MGHMDADLVRTPPVSSSQRNQRGLARLCGIRRFPILPPADPGSARRELRASGHASPASRPEVSPEGPRPRRTIIFLSVMAGPGRSGRRC